MEERKTADLITLPTLTLRKPTCAKFQTQNKRRTCLFPLLRRLLYCPRPPPPPRLPSLNVCSAHSVFVSGAVWRTPRCKNGFRRFNYVKTLECSHSLLHWPWCLSEGQSAPNSFVAVTGLVLAVWTSHDVRLSVIRGRLRRKILTYFQTPTTLFPQNAIAFALTNKLNNHVCIP